MMGVVSRWNRRKKCNARFSEAARRGGFSVSRLKLSFGRGGRAQMFGKTVYAEYGRTAAIVVCACVSLLGAIVSFAKTAEPIHV